MTVWHYSASFILMVLCYLAVGAGAFFALLPPIFVFGIIPLLETLPAMRDPLNPGKEEEDRLSRSLSFDLLLYLAVLLQVGLVALLIFYASRAESVAAIWAEAISVGLACGIYGINVGHELGHRPGFWPQTLARISLYSSLYAHFRIEHNYGHHRRVATPGDPATARSGEFLYFFYIRSIIGSYLSAWRITRSRLRSRHQAFFSWHNEMLIDHLVQLLLALSIYVLAGGVALQVFLLAAAIGILLLETVNYIEHYGLLRARQGDRFERVRPRHSWNSNHIPGRIFLFNLPRHSDHHAEASRKYQLLRHFEESPQMPVGYPAMMILAFFPGLFFRVMDPLVAAQMNRVQP